ncbi:MULTISPECIES: cyclic-di-AMP-binding protein CbpB [Streptococcus]|uniref:CBS domain-containing protein n=1 Tax=Streptococcus ruminantium TaxID=1917441 RepID=A0A2Z5U506_9STRE|nr:MULTISPECIES: cyclic-di-AMP-binding protein CbpB [Streptococcus]MDQ8759131.1 cyclic-di-AMP-binding protein CbpB [Streptococcus ruminantium]MDQ8764331.1 cyclic-di-AMP-binding protein CbpB [Streptococcus ruminantium]MDQ8767026.1 cyclic-di-AMP-binding protein CbpB [Streptococcus ruminantium]MDQ8769593.1 cyclic-di-AMP-binding protein CbpB [Streptococcus ruminantium]MDQ8775477.1 cyclic-di-AMP-binding protein CbpB [Streptococcus ruminantium]
MIAREFEQFLLAQEETFLTPADKLAVIIDTHNIDHAKLLLSHMTYSRVPVVTEEGQFFGTIGLTEIIKYQAENELTDDELNKDISLIARTDEETVGLDYELTEVMRKLVDQSFLPVLGENREFIGIITRKSILKTINALLHNFPLVSKEGKK